MIFDESTCTTLPHTWNRTEFPAASISILRFLAGRPAPNSFLAPSLQVVGGALLPTRMGISSCSLQGNQADGGSGGGLAAVVFPAPVGRLRFAWATPNPEIPESAAGPDPTSGAGVEVDGGSPPPAEEGGEGGSGGRRRELGAAAGGDSSELPAARRAALSVVARLSYSLVLDSSVLQGNSAAGDG